MKSKAVLATLAILVVFPAALSAQRAGFLVGLGSGYAHQHIYPRVLGYPGVQGYPGITGYPVVTGPTVITTAPRSAGFIFPGAHQLPRATVVPHGSVLFVGPQVVKIAPGHEPRTPTHPVAPGVAIVTPGNRGVVPGGYYGGNYGAGYYGTAIVQRPNRPAVATRPSRGHTLGTGQILVGTPRADVITHFGRPKVQILNRQSETLIFGGTTIIIRNGVVAEFR
jgi:hypothetical protein